MRLAIGSISGTVFHAEGHPGFRQDNPAFAFVPDEILFPWSEEGYREGNWSTHNAWANSILIGSEAWPDLDRKVSAQDLKGKEGQFFLSKIRFRLATLQVPEPSARVT